MAKVEGEIKIISRENIKPSSPTPLHLKTFNLSSFDIVYPSNVYADLLMFYQFHDHDQDQDQDRRVNDLKSSLSETLTRFYPLAGRLKGNEPLSVDCTDEGAEFIEAKVSCRLSDILNPPNPKFLSRLYPNDSVPAQDDHVLLVQTNLFDCGGIAIGVSISHRVSDAATLFLFIKGWAAQARGCVVATPNLNVIASCFPGEGPSARKWSAKRDITAARCITRRYVYDSKSINALRAKATSASVQRPSRVQVITGHICLSMMKLNSRAKSYVFTQPMNLRKKLLDPPISENSFGNFIGLFLTHVRKSDKKATTLDYLASEFTNGLQTQIEKFAKMNDVLKITTRVREIRTEWKNILYSKKDVETVFVSSICKSGCYENSDFGWGEPIWVGYPDGRMKNLVVLIDTKDGDGIEAWVTLDEHNLDLLETDQDFIEFATLNSTLT